MIKDVVDGLKIVAEGIDSVKTITEAIKSGQNYVTTTHPDINADLRAMLAEMGKSMFVIKRASAVLTNFRFAIAHDTQGSELARFNDYFIQSKTEAQHLRAHIDDLRTHCSRIRDHAFRITSAKNASGFAGLFSLLGLRSAQREAELGERLDRLAFEDFAVANSAEAMLHSLEAALNDVQHALGSGGAMYPYNVPAAAALLAAYGAEFEQMETRALLAGRDIRELVQALR